MRRSIKGIPVVGVVSGPDARFRVPVEPPADRLGRRIVGTLARFGEVSTGFIASTVSGAPAAEIERRLCDLSTAGVIVPRRATEPRRHGAGRRDTIEVTYWRLAAGE